MNQKSLSLNHLLVLQMVYCFLGIMYNVGSMLSIRIGLQDFATTDPVFGVVGMSLYGLFLSSGLLKTQSLYRILMGISVLMLGYGGIVVHLMNVTHRDLYQSVWTWVGAIGINAFGLVLNAKAALGQFKHSLE